MKDMIIGSAIIRQDMLECPRGEMDKRVRLIIGNPLINIDDPQDKPDQRSPPEDPIYVRRIFFSKKKVVKRGANRLGWTRLGGVAGLQCKFPFSLRECFLSGQVRLENG